MGIDIGEGPGVDVVAGGHEYNAPDGSFDVVISCECMEHNPYWVKTLENTVRMLRSGGLCVITCAAPGRKEHGTRRSRIGSSPLTVASGWEYYRNLDARTFSTVAVFWRAFDRYGTWKNYRTCDFYFTGLKRADPGSLSPEISADWERYVAAVQDWARAQNAGLKPKMNRLTLVHRGRRWLRALVHESELARKDPAPLTFHLPMAYDAGLPSPVIRFRMSHAIIASVTRQPGERARRPSPRHCQVEAAGGRVDR